MDKADFKKQLKELFEHNIDGLTWDEKMRVICGTLVEVDKTQESNKESAITKSTQRVFNLFKYYARFMKVCYQFVRYMLENEEKIFSEVKSLVQEELKQSIKLDRQKFALSVMFPKGYRPIFRAYEDYRKSSLFRSRMEAANQLLTRLRIYAKINVLNDFDSFTNDLAISLKHDIEKRAKNAKPHQVDSDLMIIPDELDLRQYYLKTLKPKRGNN